MEQPDLQQQWLTLKAEHDALVEETARLSQQAPSDAAAHQRHLEKLHDHIGRLHAFTEAVHRSREQPHASGDPAGDKSRTSD
jgi:hypothetical protein